MLIDAPQIHWYFVVDPWTDVNDCDVLYSYYGLLVAVRICLYVVICSCTLLHAFYAFSVCT